MITLYKILHWVSLILAALGLLLILGFSFHMIQKGIPLPDWDHDFDVLGILAGELLLLSIVVVLLPLKWICKKYTPETKRYGPHEKKAMLVFVALAALDIIIIWPD